MDDKQNLSDKLLQINESYEPDPNLASRAIEKINQREATVTFKRPAYKWVWYSLCGFLLIALVVFLSVYLTKNYFKLTIYSADKIELEKINEMENFCIENNLSFRYFKNEGAINSIAKIKDTGAFAYITQSFDDIGEAGFDKIELKIVLIKKAEFEFYNYYISLLNSIIVSDVKVQYSAYEDINLTKLYAKFEFEENLYFLEIHTRDSGTAVLEKYIYKLLN